MRKPTSLPAVNPAKPPPGMKYPRRLKTFGLSPEALKWISQTQLMTLEAEEERGLRRLRRVFWGWAAALLMICTIAWMQSQDDLAQLRFECEVQRSGWEWDGATDTCQKQTLKEPANAKAASR